MAFTQLCHSRNTTKCCCLLLFYLLLAVLSVAAERIGRTADVVYMQGKSVHTAKDSSIRKPTFERLQDAAIFEQHEEFMDEGSQQPHSRRKRLIWITDDGRLALPPGTSLTFTPTIALPLVRHPPEGFFSNISISFPVTIDFDKLGLTDNQNPLGDLPPIFARSFGEEAGRMLGQYVSSYLHAKAKREVAEQLHNEPSAHRVHKKRLEDLPEFPELPERFKHIFHGGERVMLYGVLENFISTFGLNGKACLLRTICEVHSRNLEHFGVFGEMTKLFLTVTRSPFADLIPEYVRAQRIGEGQLPPGECFPFYKECPKSIFKTLQKHNYDVQQTIEYEEQEAVEVMPAQLLQNQHTNEIEETFSM